MSFDFKLFVIILFLILQNKSQKVSSTIPKLEGEKGNIVSQINCRGLFPSLNDKIIILNFHNYYRNQLALRTNAGPLFPYATDMLQMYWSDELAYKAQQWANRCSFQHSSSSYRRTALFTLGENLYTEGRSNGFPTPDWRKAINSWWSEINLWRYYMNINSYQFYSATGHFTQLIWSKTYLIGCAASQYYQNGYYNILYVCEYGPAGNVMGYPIYKSSSYRRCDCPDYTNCSNPFFPGLCCPAGFCSTSNLVYTGRTISGSIIVSQPEPTIKKTNKK